MSEPADKWQLIPLDASNVFSFQADLIQETSFMYETTACNRVTGHYVITVLQHPVCRKTNLQDYISISSKSIGECHVPWCFEYTG